MEKSCLFSQSNTEQKSRIIQSKDDLVKTDKTNEQ